MSLTEKFEQVVLNQLAEILKGQEDIKDAMKDLEDRLTELEVTCDSSGLGYTD